MAWKKLTEEELNTLEFDFDEDAIERGLENARFAAEAVATLLQKEGLKENLRRSYVD